MRYLSFITPNGSEGWCGCYSKFALLSMTDWNDNLVSTKYGLNGLT